MQDLDDLTYKNYCNLNQVTPVNANIIDYFETTINSALYVKNIRFAVFHLKYIGVQPGASFAVGNF